MNLKRIFSFFVIFSILSILLIFAVNYYGSARINAGSSGVVYSNQTTSLCKYVDNSGALDIFVPAKTDAELNSIASNPPTGVSVGACGTWGPTVGAPGGGCPPSFCTNPSPSGSAISGSCGPVGTVRYWSTIGGYSCPGGEPATYCYQQTCQ